MEIIYKRRIKIQCRVFVIALSIVIIFSSVFCVYCQTVYAAAEAIPIILEQLPKVVEGVRWALSSGGDGTVMSSEFVQEFYNACQDQINPIECLQNSDGTVTFSEEALSQLRDILDEYLAENPEVIDVVWTPVITEKNLKSSWFDSISSYNKSVEVVREHGLVGFRREVASGGVVYPPAYPLSVQFYYTELNGYFPVYIDLSDTVYVDHFNESFINGVTYISNSFGNETTTPLLTGSGWILTQNGVVTYPTQYVLKDGVWTSSFNFGHKNYYSFVLNPFYTDVVNYSSYTDYYVMVASSDSGIHYVPIFKSAAAYSDYVTGNGNYYRFDSGYTGGDVTINPDADYSEITDAIKDAMLAAISSGKSVSNALSDMQKAFTSSLDKINGTLGDISDNTAEMNEWLEKIYQKLSEIYNTDDDNDSAFDLLFSGLRSMTVLMELYDTHMDDRFLQLEALLYAYFSSASENLEESKGFLENIYDKLDDIYKKLKQILFVESADLAWDILSKLFDSINDWIKNKFTDFGILAAASTVGDVMKTKFPFSIPWDIYAILLMFDAPPKPPVISLHFEFPFIEFEWDYEYVMNDKAWSDLATVCRFFLTIGYEITLIHLTQKLYMAGLFDTPSIGRKKH